MVGKTAHKTAEDEQRIDICKRMIGCLPCLLVNRPDRHSDYHHIVDGNKRLGHEWGYPMCLFHHRGELTEPCSMEWHVRNLGPSYALHRKRFRATFGPEPVLAMTTTSAMQLALDEPWNDFEMPEDIMKRIQDIHWHNRVISGLG